MRSLSAFLPTAALLYLSNQHVQFVFSIAMGRSDNNEASEGILLQYCAAWSAPRKSRHQEFSFEHREEFGPQGFGPTRSQCLDAGRGLPPGCAPIGENPVELGCPI